MEIVTDIITASPEETLHFAENRGRALPHDQHIALIGDLGAGKTTFIKGLAKDLGITEEVSSPSFNILNIFHGRQQLLHIDAYRLDCSPASRDSLFLDDLSLSPFCMVVEWPDRLYHFLDECQLIVQLEATATSSRHITIFSR